MNQDRKNEIKDYAMRADLVDSSAVLDLLGELDSVNSDNRLSAERLHEAGYLVDKAEKGRDEAKSELELAKAKIELFNEVLEIISEVSLCNRCKIYNQDQIERFDKFIADNTKEKV